MSTDEDASTNLSSAAREFSWWGALWGWLIGTFLLFATITNLLHGLFGFQLLPIFQNTLTDFRAFLHWAMDTFLFAWITWLLAHAWLALTQLLSLLFAQVQPSLPLILVPDWYKDLAIVSAVLSRAQLRGLDITDSETEFGDDEHQPHSDHFKKTQGHALSQHPILAIFLVLVSIPMALLHFSIYWIVFAVQWLIFVLLRNGSIAGFVGSGVNVALRGISMVGILQFTVMSFNAWMHRTDTDAFWTQHRLFARWSWYTLIMAIVASAGFFVWNGYALDALTR